MNFKILWVEKDDFVNSPLEEVLQLEAFNIIWTEEGKCAIQIAQEMQPNLIISRLNLSDHKTRQFLERLGQNEATAKIPLIVIASDEADAPQENGYNYRANWRTNQYWTTPQNVGQMIQELAHKVAS
ncbi:response regulator [Lyngbya sp. CCY1209]|jgi:CheY-like chemotaxis protein|uniref:response regulator n=1 Tax=Lyngbya sp. CCY1209 TaxID=2886103 RepID=UPI002D2016AF|nr:response regulator [Lyngbya sp. CCY1209]MEB3884914.1 response regulator [Lyngbya sp. CCY1209]